jgi:Putative Ig domain
MEGFAMTRLFTSLVAFFVLTIAANAQCASGYTQLNNVFVCQLNSGVPVITSPGTASGTVGTAFSYQITATNSPTSFNASGLPSPLSVNTSTGLISGTPTATSTNTVALSATNASGTGNQNLMLTIGSGGAIQVGYTTIPTGLNGAGSWTAGGTLNAWNYAPPRNGTAVSIAIYVNSGSAGTSNLLGIYSSSGGAPGTLLASTANFTPVAGWNTVNLTTPLSVTSGTQYFLAEFSNSTSLTGKQDDGSGITASVYYRTGQTGLTTPFGTPTNNFPHNTAGIYMNVN